MRPTRPHGAGSTLAGALLVSGLVSGLVTGLVVGSLAAPARAAVPVSELSPAALPRGADIAVPHLEDHTIVDGAVRLPVRGEVVRLLGRSGSAYVVVTGDERGGHGRAYRVDAAGQTLLGQAQLYTSRLDGDGATVVTWSSNGEDRTNVRVRSASTGGLVAQRQFAGYVTVLDAQRDLVLLGSQRVTRTWTPSTGATRTVSPRYGYAGDLGAGLLATFTKDPYRGGCTEVLDLATGDLRWRSCNQRVDAFSTDGSRMATIDKLSDGIGPSFVIARTTDGRAVGRYTVAGWFGELTWESSRSLLLPTNGPRRATVVRCTGSTCERAAGLTKTEQPRLAG